MQARVLFVSKPIVPPFFDGTKCVVRDVATHLTRYAPIVMGTALPPGPELAPRAGGTAVRVASVYGGGGSYAPSLAENARAAAWLLAGSRAELWHFVFAPNPRTSLAGRLARAIRRVPVLQTVASPPSRYAPDVFFGDIVVAQSAFTASKIARAFDEAGTIPPRLEVIPPPIGPLREQRPEDVARVRRALGLPADAPILVYPGDLEVSCGAETVARAVGMIAKELPNAIVVFACRPKTANAPRIEQTLRARLDPRRVRFTRETDLPALFATTSVVLFPVDDLHGKVDLPIALLEAMKFGVPVVAVDSGPLAELEGVARIKVGDAAGLARIATRLVRDANHRAELVARARVAIAQRYDAAVVASAYELLYDDLLCSPAANRAPRGRLWRNPHDPSTLAG